MIRRSSRVKTSGAWGGWVMGRLFCTQVVMSSDACAQVAPGNSQGAWKIFAFVGPDELPLVLLAYQKVFSGHWRSIDLLKIQP